MDHLLFVFVFMGFYEKNYKFIQFHQLQCEYLLLFLVFYEANWHHLDFLDCWSNKNTFDDFGQMIIDQMREWSKQSGLRFGPGAYVIFQVNEHSADLSLALHFVISINASEWLEWPAALCNTVSYCCIIPQH